MSEMVERVANAIAKDQGVNLGELERRFHVNHPMASMYRRMAHVAIEAMRHPSELMIEAGNAKCGVFNHGENTWHAMIEAALNEAN